MQTSTLSERSVAWGRRLKFVAVALGLVLVLVFAFAHRAAAQLAAGVDPPLSFGNNYFVTGDYVVAGAYGLTSHFQNGFATGTINVPDTDPATGKPNPGITGATSVPVGAQVVAALLYWQTVEKVAEPGTGQNGFFGPVLNKVVQNHAITGLNITNHNTVSFSSGGCSGTSTGKVLVTYRADVRPFLALDATGNVIADNITYQIQLPSVGNQTPLTLGATLVLIYRVFNANAPKALQLPLNSIVIYDGAFAPTAASLNFLRPVQGFYDAEDPLKSVLRVTHIVGDGKSNKLQKASFINQSGVATPLPSLYGGPAAFIGSYGGSWDNPTWTLKPGPYNTPTGIPIPANPVAVDDASAQLMVTPNTSNQGCVSWAATIVSTLVKSTDGDGLPDSWKNHQGFCDASFNEAGTKTDKNSCISAGSQWVDLTGAATPGQGMKDIFVQYDYMCSSTDGKTCDRRYDFNPPQSTLNMVKNAFSLKNINVHFVPGPGGAIPEQFCTVASDPTCLYVGQPGIIAWEGGFDFLKNQPLNKNADGTNWTEAQCEANPTTCMRRVQHGEKDSHHELILAHAMGVPEYSFQGGSLISVAASSNTATVTFTISTKSGLTSNDRVNVSYATTNPSLNGTYPVLNANDTGPGPYTFSISFATKGNPVYTALTDPQLSVATSHVRTGSGISHIGGGGLVVSLGLWGADGQTDQARAGTIMHELGHNLGLVHSRWDYVHDYVPEFQPNCELNYQSVMNYMFQVDLLDTGNPGAPLVLDYSENTLDAINESTPPYDLALNKALFSTFLTKWYVRDAPQGVGSPATHFCDGRSLGLQDQAFRLEGSAAQLALLATVSDLNFDGTTSGTPAGGQKDWDLIDPSLLGGTADNTLGGGGSFGSGAGSFGSGSGSFGSGAGSFGSGSGSFGSGAGSFGSGSGSFGSGTGSPNQGEFDFATANSVTRPPRNLTAMENNSPRTVTLNWNAPTFGQIVAYNVYRSENNGPFVIINAANTNPPHTVVGNPPVTTFTDTVTCDQNGFRYFVTAVVLNPGAQESVPSNIVSTGQFSEALTGCYLPPVFSSPTPGSSPLAGNPVQVIWSVQVASNQKGVTFANNTGSNSLVVIGPISDDVTCVGSGGQNTPHSTIAPLGMGNGISPFGSNQFTFSWNTLQGFIGFPAQNLPPGPFPQGCYRLELDMDSGQPAKGTDPASAFQVQIYLADINESVQVNTTSLPDGLVGTVYNPTLTEAGGVGGVVWSSSGMLPPGITLNANGTFTGTPTAPGTYTFTVKATDSIGDFGTQVLTVLINDVVTTTADSGTGSLRQVIMDVNGAPSGPRPITILFNIPGGGVQTITPTSPLPALTQPTILDGTTQPVYAGTPLIEVNGSTAGAPATGIHILAGNSTVRGLVIDSFNGDGILIDTKGGNVIQGNYVGTNPAGTQAAPNTGNGIQIIAVPNNTVGGAAASMRNIISGNGGEGVRIDGTLATGNIVRGNYVGTDVTGSVAVGNTASGVYLRRAPGNSVIGNVVSGNVGFAGITICGSAASCGGGDPTGIDETSNAASNIVQGNLVGTNAAGTAALGNNQAGVSIDGAPNTVVGGTAAGAANTISFNGTNDVQIFDAGANGNQIKGNAIQGTGANNDVGISVGVISNTALTGNTLSGNAISGHAGLGIDLNPIGINQNTAGGANNFPVISSATASSGMVSGMLNGPANATFTIEFFSNSACNASGNGEGAVFLGSTMVTTGGDGNFTFMVSVAGLGNTVTATSTDANGTTSEFSACVAVSP